MLTDRELAGRVHAGGPLVLPARYRWFRKLRPPRVRLLAGVVAYANALLAVIAGLQGAAEARRGGTRWILSVVDGGFSPIAGAIAARLSGRPHLVMAFDLWEENAYSPAERRLAGLLERRIMREAAAVVVYCENAAEHYRAKHGATCAVIATPIDVPDESVAAPTRPCRTRPRCSWRAPSTGRRRTRCGGSSGRRGARRAPRSRSSATRRDLRRRGIHADRYEPPLEAEAFRDRLRRAGVLFLGLSLDSPTRT